MFNKSAVIDFVKRNSIISELGYAIRASMYKRKMSKYKHLPIQDNKIMFYRSGAGFGDNQKYISLFLSKNVPDVEQVWAVSDENVANSLPGNICPVIINTDSFFKELSTAAVWVASNLMPEGCIKKEKQLYIQTWHGDRAIKKIVNDALDNESYRKRKHNRVVIENTICDYITTGSIAAERMYRSAIGYQGQYLRYGCPRNDCLFYIDQLKAASIKRSLNISEEHKIAMYAPTFRDHKGSQGEVDSDIDLLEILDALEAKDHSKWMMLIRAHGSEKLRSQREVEERIVDVTLYPDMAELLLVTDFLFTDYSSCATDYAITGRPIIMYQDDYNEYISKDRSLYFKMEDSPFLRARNMKELINLIEVITPELAKENDKDILDFFGTYENGMATDKICSVITDWFTKKC